jgi:hypothetical protein
VSIVQCYRMTVERICHDQVVNYNEVLLQICDIYVSIFAMILWEENIKVRMWVSELQN